MAEQREGATAEQIERFQELVRHPLPPLYVEFLERFGERSLIHLGRDGRQRVADLITLYETEADAFPANTVVVCTPAISAGTLLVYGGDLAQPFVATAYDHDLEPMESPSFTHHLYRCAWSGAQWSNNTQVTFRSGDAAALADSVERTGFERLWFGGGAAFCLEDGVTAVLLVREGPGARAVLMSRSSSARERLARWMARAHGGRQL